MSEQWRPVVDYEGYYEVSDQGQVRSLDRTITDTLGRTTQLAGRTLRPSTRHLQGYTHVVLRRDGKRVTRLIHQLVLEAFIGPRPVDMVSLHFNDVPNDNRLTNLRYGTRSANNYDKVRNGHDHNASKTHCKYGHELTADNLYSCATNNSRYCKVCAKRRAKAQKQKRKAAA